MFHRISEKSCKCSNQKGTSVLINTTFHIYTNKHFKNTWQEWCRKGSPLSLLIGYAKT